MFPDMLPSMILYVEISTIVFGLIAFPRHFQKRIFESDAHRRDLVFRQNIARLLCCKRSSVT